METYPNTQRSDRSLMSASPRNPNGMGSDSGASFSGIFFRYVKIVRARTVTYRPVVYSTEPHAGTKYYSFMDRILNKMLREVLPGSFDFGCVLDA
uniref:Uncharacterized protein n=1 Tax=Candidatus Kentrum eta TaxID=2126337 RepID=A0A450UBX9_9GAMM|nr:MAG: hypothetical protein BECKH772A_GA0070896_1001225 [Candidatus Kentron sp. H]VFJ89748.1 MAG: hypothetical protein BECKH772B_GA0070898_1000633 [Candidatus Kentron sp. H]VFJ97213.1 MAG: hypothetical protein BECKH772C_GA0070978_1001125 [Candidatus Kentron sp. H]